MKESREDTDWEICSYESCKEHAKKSINGKVAGKVPRKSVFFDL